MTIPAANPTKPGVPSSLTVTGRPGMIDAAWLPPVVVPSRTRYKIISAVNCGDATTGFTYWDGNTHHASFPFTFDGSGHWWWVQAYTDTDSAGFSAYFPNTYGVFGVPQIPADLSGQKIIPDGQFRSGASITSYWGSISNALPCSLSPTGGMTDGTGYISCVGTNNFGGFPNWNRPAFCARDFRPGGANVYAECAPGQHVNWYVVARRTATLAGSVGAGEAGLFFQADLKNTIGGVPNLANVGSTFLRLDNRTLNEWQTYVGSFQISPNTPWEHVAPSLVFGNYALSSGTIQVGRFDAYLV